MIVCVFNDDPNNELHSDDCWWIAVTADRVDQAYIVAAANYDGYRDEKWFPQKELSLVSVHQPSEVTANPIGKFEVINCQATLRKLGFKEEGEMACDTCGLYPHGIDRFSVCDECTQCTECGCCCNE